jgi:Spy/CpxP family protein refolding chaperone
MILRNSSSVSRALLTSALVVVASVSLSACGASASVEEEVDSPEAAVESSEQASEPHRRGPGAMIVDTALEELELTTDQRAKVQGLFTKTAPSAEAREAHLARAKELADAVRDGKVDPSAFPKPEGKPDKRAEFAKDLDALHALLTPAQRADLVAALRDRMPEGPPEGKGRGRGGEGPRGRGGPLGFLLHDLGLSDAQRTSIETALGDAGVGPKGRARPDVEDMKRKIEAALDAFEKDGFEAADVLPEPPAGAGPHELIEVLAVVVPLLTDEQREQLADRIEEGPMRRGPKGRRGDAE